MKTLLALCALSCLSLLVAAQDDAESSLTIAVPFPRRHCFLKPDPGPCRGSFPKWFYNSKTKQCERFTYGGCRGNKNRFDSKKECESECAPPRNICNQKPDSGPCEAAIPRWFFNPRSGKCEQFIYGGCKGNSNNFETRLQCQRACRKDCLFVRCFADPCQVIKCEAFPDATCVANFCTGCDADFFVNGRLVDCKKKPVDCIPQGGRCIHSPTATSVEAIPRRRCCPGTKCCSCGPPVVREDFKPSPFGTCQKRCICPVG